jgi:hypothetical protein
MPLSTVDYRDVSIAETLATLFEPVVYLVRNA